MAPLNLVSRLLGLTLFPNFSRLPKELRDTIWEYAILEPRIVPLRRRRLASDSFSSNVDGNASTDRNEGRWGFKCDLPPPAVLFVNRESYEATRRFYTPRAFPCIRDNHTSVGETCIDFDRDTLYLDVDWTLQIFYRGHEIDEFERARVKNLAILFSSSSDPSFAEELAGRECTAENELWVAQFLAYFVNLKSVTIVLEHVECPKHENNLTSEQTALAFTDAPIDVNAALDVFADNDNIAGRPPITTHPRHLTFDMSLLEQRRLECLYGGEAPEEWQMPKIGQSVMVSTALKSVLDKNLKEVGFVGLPR